MAQVPPSSDEAPALLQSRGKPSAAQIWCVQFITFFRIFASLLFASLAFQQIPISFLASIYCAAMLSDLVDGLLARRLQAESFGGKIADLISDKSLTVVSLLYAAERGASLPPLAIIGVREMIVLGARAIAVKGSQLLPTSRFFGGVMASLLWSNTLLLLFQRDRQSTGPITNDIYWGCAVVLGANLARRIYVSRQQIKVLLTSGG